MGNRNSGPRPAPTKLKLLRGVARRDRLNEAEPQPPEGTPEKPAELSPGASRMWDEWAPICLHMGTLTVADVRPFAMMCELQAVLLEAAAVKQEPDGLMKAVQIEKLYAPMIRQYYALFGLEPVSRARIQVKKAEPPASKWAGVLK